MTVALVTALAAFSIFGSAAMTDIGTLKSSGVRHVTAQEAATLLEARPVARVLDVRTGWEHRRGHVKGAAHASYFSLSFRNKIEALDMSTPWVVQCATGHRSLRAVRLLKAAGAREVYHLDGGMRAWRRAGLPVVRP